MDTRITKSDTQWRCPLMWYLCDGYKDSEKTLEVFFYFTYNHFTSNQLLPWKSSYPFFVFAFCSPLAGKIHRWQEPFKFQLRWILLIQVQPMPCLQKYLSFRTVFAIKTRSCIKTRSPWVQRIVAWHLHFCAIHRHSKIIHRSGCKR